MKGIEFMAFGIFLTLLFSECSLPIDEEEIMGVYVNRNYSRICGAEISNEIDTLQLLSNNIFKSLYYGEGTYKLINTHSPLLKLSYQYEYGMAGYSAYMSKTPFSTIKIITNYDLDCFYEKISD